MKKILVFGSTGTIGKSVLDKCLTSSDLEIAHSVSRTPLVFNDSRIKHYLLDFDDEDAYRQLADKIDDNSIDMILISIGFLHTDSLKPEKSIKDVSSKSLNEYFKVNLIYPSLIIKYFYKKILKDQKSIILVLSAKVGSISQNELGGWHGYRVSKAALNMMIKNVSLELQRYNKESVVSSLHPGTVRSRLTEPYLNNINHKIYEPSEAANNIYLLLNKIDKSSSGHMIDYLGNIITP